MKRRNIKHKKMTVEAYVVCQCTSPASCVAPCGTDPIAFNYVAGEMGYIAEGIALTNNT